MTGRVRWQPGAGENLLGYVGTLPSWSFQIFRSGDEAEGWKLIAPQIPGLARVTARSLDLSELQGQAEDWLAAYVTSIGAVFLDPQRHKLAPKRMVGRQLQPPRCTCGEPWPCPALTAGLPVRVPAPAGAWPQTTTDPADPSGHASIPLPDAPPED